jgi:hypothetical protein
MWGSWVIVVPEFVFQNKVSSEYVFDILVPAFFIFKPFLKFLPLDV